MTTQLITNVKQLYQRGLYWIAAILLITISACSSDEGVVRIFEVTVPVSTYGLEAVNDEAEIQISFSTATVVSTTIVLEVTESGVAYGTDYTTSPAVSDNTIEVTVGAGAESASFTVTRLVDYIGEGNNVSFAIQSVTGEEAAEIVGTSTVTVSFEKVVNAGATIDLETGGSTQPNQVYIDLSSGQQTAVRRDTWELGFYNGAENRVYLNAALLVSAAELTGYTDITAVNSSTTFADPYTLYTVTNFNPIETSPVTITTVQDLLDGLPVGYTQYGDEENGKVFTDSKAGELDETAIGEIATTADENYVYVVSLGNAIPTESAANPGSINTTGSHRGYMKIRILSDGSSYTLQYADIDATTYEEVTIAKDDNYNLTAFSLSNKEIVDVEPEKSKWDINHSGVFSFYAGGSGVTYSDYGLHNTLGGTGLYQLTTDHQDSQGNTVAGTTSIGYEAFTLSDVDESSFVYDDRAVIASNWRSTSAGAYDYIYYVIKDAEGNYFKLRYTALTDPDTGERGYSQLEYESL